MTTPPVRLKILLREKHWQTYRTFCAEYNKAAQHVDRDLIGKGPSRAQLHRWLSGELKGLPYPDHCRVLEQMFPGWTVDQLFEPCPPEASSRPASNPDELRTAEVSELLEAIEGGLETPESGDVTWGAAQRIPAVVTGKALLNPGPLDNQDLDTTNTHIHKLGRKLLELQRARRFSDSDIRALASLSGHLVELAELVDIDIDAAGGAIVVYRFDLLNLTNKPLSRVTREIWFEHTEDTLTIKPTSDSERRLVIQRIHDTPTLSKFAFQISPPLQAGESAKVGYRCEGGKFEENLYWRQSMPRYTRHYTLRIQHRGIELSNCTATEEHPDGSENSATDSLMWDIEDDGAIMILTRNYLRPNQAITLRWEVIHGTS